jgi:O-antigen/teichoic acid export membrane protein
VLLSAQVVDWGSRDALLRAFSREPAAIASTWQTSLISRAVLLPLGPLLFLAIGSGAERATWLGVWFVALVIARSHDALVAYRRAFGFALAVELIATVAVLAAVASMASRLTVDALVVVFALAAVLRAVLLTARFRVLRVRRWEGRFDPGVLRRSVPFFVLTFSGALGSRVDLYVVAAMLPVAALAQYQVLTGLVLLIQALSASLIAPVVPSLYRVPRRLIASAAARLLAVGLVVTPVAIGGAWLALVLLYRIELPAWVLLAAWLATLPVYGYLPLVHRAYRDGRERLVLAANASGIAVAAVGTLSLAGGFGIGGAMLSAAAGQATVGTVLLVAERRWAPATPRTNVPDALSGV